MNNLDLEQYPAQAGTGNCLSSWQEQGGFWPQQGYQYVIRTCSGHPGAQEFRIWRDGKEVRMDYGEELKLLMADPVKGMHLREAVQHLKTALLELKD